MAQSYAELKAECLGKTPPFEDPEFPADGSSIGTEEADEYTWMRPHEICEARGSGGPEFIGDDRHSTVIQGRLGDCWVIVACAGISNNPTTFHKVVPQDQSFAPEDYCGVFRFNFWRYGQWREIVVDDRLPTEADRNGRPQLVFAHSTRGNEFWGALLEKAYAKVHRSYQALEVGNAADALTDLTGGLVIHYNLKNPNNTLPHPRELVEGLHSGEVLAVANIVKGASYSQRISMNGLVSNHAYNITSIKEVETNDGEVVVLIQIINPWGNNVEWNGDWSDKSDRWETLSEEQKSALSFKDEDDGAFWIELTDFKRLFTDFMVCYLLRDGDEVDGGNEWTHKCIENSWTGESGGGDENSDGFSLNPQIPLQFNTNIQYAVVELMQKNRREQGREILSVSFRVYRTESDQEDRLEIEHLLGTRYLTGTLRNSGKILRQRSVVDKFEVDPSYRYIVVPYTENQGQEAEFLVRVLQRTSSVD